MNIVKGSLYTIGQIVFTVLKVDNENETALVRHIDQRKQVLTFLEIHNLIIQSI
jgi:hypothetical protein